jgi:DNA replication licensing factor MCM2
LREWIVMDGPRREIARRFRQFLGSYVDANGRPIYKERIQNMCLGMQYIHLRSIALHLSASQPILSSWVADAPSEMIQIFNEVAYAVVLEMFPAYERICKQIYVRMLDCPIKDTLRSLRYIYHCMRSDNNQYIGKFY